MRRALRLRHITTDHEIFTPADGASPEHQRVLGIREAVGVVSHWLDDPHNARDLLQLFHGRGQSFEHGLDESRRRLALGAWLQQQIESGFFRVAELHPPPPLPPNPGAKAEKALKNEEAPAKEKLGWFEVMVVDAWGKPVDGVELEFAYEGTRKKVTTPGSGKIKVPDVPASFGSARITNQKAVRDAIKPRWKDKTQPEEPPKDAVNPERIEIDGSNLVASVESEVLKTLVLVMLPDWMTISFIMPSSPDVAFPKYALESTDGAYKKELTAKDDCVPGDKYLQLKFENLLPGKLYKLTRFDDAEISQVIFDKVRYEEVVDQEREMHADMIEHGYGEFDFDQPGDKLFDDWQAGEGAA